MYLSVKSCLIRHINQTISIPEIDLNCWHSILYNDNICSEKKYTKRSSNTLLRLVSLFSEQMLSVTYKIRGKIFYIQAYLAKKVNLNTLK